MRRPAVQAYPDEESLEIAVRGGARRRGRARAKLPPVRLVVRHGDLRYTRNPLVVGHYFGDAIVSAEQVLDQFLDQRLSTRLQLGLYPGQRNTAEVFLNPDPAKPSAIVIGLGAVGELTSVRWRNASPPVCCAMRRCAPKARPAPMRERPAWRRC